MKNIEPPQEILDCLNNEMNVKIAHFLTKYHSFDHRFKSTINDLLSRMLIDSLKLTKLDGEVHYYNKGNAEQNDFMQAMFDCFRSFNSCKGLELHKELYEHINRGGESWFPIVEIASAVDDYSNQSPIITVFRGCFFKEFESNNYRQSWTSEFEVAKAFAFTHYNIDNENRVVIKVTVNNSDIAWMRSGESEVVLLPSFTPLSSMIELNYNQYCQSREL
ncbi:MAG: hypothetical protein COA47_14745 [Robiginitomaculum sp.]|nr:MAG: hypothetical protein COA47_14745 [Robiginitomaculum sp.]